MALILIFFGLGNVALLDNNEGMYAEISREMLVAHDWRGWIIPHLNGLPYMEKPPLLYWLTASSFTVFGENAWAARMVPACSALACVFSLLRFGERNGVAQSSRLAALMFITGTGVVVMARVLMFDMLLTALLTAALMRAWEFAQFERKPDLRWAYTWLALAMLAKGLVALALFGMVMTVYLLHQVIVGCRTWQSILDWFEPKALMIAAVILVPWHIAASMTEASFAWFYFVNEHYLRFLGLREPHDYYAGPWWYYLPRVLIYLFPWSLFLPFAVFSTLGKRAESELGSELGSEFDSEQSRRESDLRRFLGYAWLLPLVFFSVSSAKANYYLVTVMPFACLHLAFKLRFVSGRLWRWLPALLLAALCAWLNFKLRGQTLQALSDVSILGRTGGEFVRVILTVLTLASLVVAVLAWRVARYSLCFYVLPAAVCAAALYIGLGALENRVSMRPVVNALDQSVGIEKVCLYQNFEQQSSLSFYLKRTVCVVDSHSSDLYWGNRLQANTSLVTVEQYLASLRQEPSVLLVMDHQLEQFKATALFHALRERAHIGYTTVFVSPP